MASVEIPGKPRRWGNESTNFYQRSFMQRPGSASPFTSHRCYGSFYTHSGDLHIGTKVFNQKQPLDRYGTHSAYKLRMEDQKLPRPLATHDVHNRRLQQEKVNPYQSHQNHYSQYTMGSKQQQLHRPHSAGPTYVQPLKHTATPPCSNSTTVTGPVDGPLVDKPVPHSLQQPSSTATSNPLYDSLSKSFYITSYQKQIDQPASKGLSRSQSMPSSKLSPYSLTSAMVKTSAVPIRPLSASTKAQSYSSKSNFLKEIATKFPTPTPQSASERTHRPSSATQLRRGSIPSLRS